MATIAGGSGSDTLDGGSGDDSLNGGSGTDTLIYTLDENTGTTDLYTGGSGIDTVQLRFTEYEWLSPIVRAQLRLYLEHLEAVKTNTFGEVSNGSASDFTFDFGNGTTLTVSMMERVDVWVNSASIDYRAPVNATPDSQVVNEDTPLIFSAANGNQISISDLDNTMHMVTLTAMHGTLTLSDVSGLNFVTGDGTGDATMTFQGTDAAINAALDGLGYTGASNFNGIDTLTIATSDGVSTDTNTVAITVNPVNDAPVATSDVLWMSNNTSLALPVAALLGNDVDVDGLTLSISAVNAEPGQFASGPVLNAASPLSGGATFQLGTGSEGGTVADPVVRTFTYTITDAAGGTSTGTVTVNVIATDNLDDVVDLSGVAPYQGALIFMKGGNNSFYGGASALNGVAGGSGDDTIDNSLGGGNLFGLGGNDVLIGGSSSDNLSGGPGDDMMDGGADTDFLDFSGAIGPINFTLVQSSDWTTVDLSSVGLGVDQYRNVEGVSGGQFDDTLIGSDLNDVLVGRGGNDTLDGRQGIDFLDLRAATGGVIFTLTQSSDLTAVNLTSVGLGVDQYKNMEGVLGSGFDDTLIGSDLDDVLQGVTGNDVLIGNAGNDVLIGGSGADTLTGGDGSDRFVYQSNFSDHPGSVDTITDFNAAAPGAGGDILDLSDLLIGYSAGTEITFMDLREVGGNTILSVDRDGTGATYGFQDIAVLQGHAGLGLSTLVTQGNIDVTV